MKQINLTLVLLLSFIYSNAQQIALQDILDGKYYQQSLSGIHSTKDGAFFTVLEADAVVKYPYQSGVGNSFSKKVLVKGRFTDYLFSEEEQYLLLESEVEPIYRHSKAGKWEVLNLETDEKQLVFEGKKIQEPSFSADARKVAFVYNNNIYYQDLKSGKSIQLTFDGEKNKIINGICDWVYEEEFGFVRHYDWNADGSAIAFVRFDESQVKEVFLPIYGKELYPHQMRFKYPKAGEDNSKVSLFVYDLAENKSTEIKLSNIENYYIPKIKFSKDKHQLAVLTSNRHQNKVDISFYDINKHQLSKLFSETDKAWIDTDNFTFEFLEDNSFLWASERDGNRHLYHYKENGKLINQVTKGDWEITDYYGYDAVDKNVYFQSNALDGKRISTERQIYRIGLDGKNTKRLTKQQGTNNASFNKTFTYFINNFSSLAQAKSYTLIDANTQNELKTLLDNTAAQSRLNADAAGLKKEIFTLKTEKGIDLNAWIIKPANFDAKKKYPVLMYQYSGPGSQQVQNSWYNLNDQWYFMLAQKGYIIVCVDGRGTGYRGTEFKKQTYLNLGKLEVEDQIDAAKALSKYAYVDASRIGIWGWSYGGFMSTNSLFKGKGVFKMGIAVAPVTNWRYYDTVYTERFMKTPQENASGYDDNSPINFAEKLEGKLLLVHGSADDNVHLQNTMELSKALIQANKQFEMVIYPDKDHSIYGGNTRLQLYQKMTNFLIDNL